MSDQVQKTITGPIAKNNKIMNESKKEKEAVIDKLANDEAEKYKKLT